jgi:hypothetical protein
MSTHFTRQDRARHAFKSEETKIQQRWYSGTNSWPRIWYRHTWQAVRWSDWTSNHTQQQSGQLGWQSDQMDTSAQQYNTQFRQEQESIPAYSSTMSAQRQTTAPTPVFINSLVIWLMKDKTCHLIQKKTYCDFTFPYINSTPSCWLSFFLGLLDPWRWDWHITRNAGKG